jgi:DNA-binding SARP family transcriptional activator/tetratricopeptide (TPR) repeat protein
MTKVNVTLLGRFEVAIDGEVVPASNWGRRHPAALVKVLALATGRTLHREQVIDLVWPDDRVDQATPKLHKAAHYARRATGRPDAVVLRDEMVLLFPGADVIVDVDGFEHLARAALANGDADKAERALLCWGGELLPADRYEDWAEGAREHLRIHHLEMLRLTGRWSDVIELDPADESAHVALMRQYAEAGDRHAGLRQFERLDRALRRELGVVPSAEAMELHGRLVEAGPPATTSPPLVGRERELAAVDELLSRVSDGRGGTLLITGPAGIGKSTLLAHARRTAAGRGWRVGHGSASALEAPWPYAPVIEALADVCRRHTSLLDGLSDIYRAEIDRVLAGDLATWSGESGHQRLFVACSELVHLAAGAHGLLLTIDDLHDGDDATLRLVHYLARATVDQRVALVASYRQTPRSAALHDTRASLLSRHAATELELRPLERDAIEALIATRIHQPDADVVERISVLSGGLPFAVDELARRAGEEQDWVRFVDVHTIGGIPPATREVLQRVAVVGFQFDTDQFVALSGLDESDAYGHLDASVAAGVIEAADAGYQFRHGLVRDALLHDLPPHRRRLIHRHAADRLAALGASPARVGHHLLEAGDAGRAASHLLQAAESAAAVGAYRDALDTLEPIRAHVAADDRPRLLALRADLLLAVGDPTAIGAYRDALDVAARDAQPHLRARLARAAIMAGDIATATAALDGIDVSGGTHDAEVLLARASVAFFTADFDTAWAITEEAQRRILGGERSWQVLDLVSLQGLLAHNRGEWFDRIRAELRRTRDTPEIANAVFDGYLCAAEYLLYGPTPYREIIELAGRMRVTAERSGALRAAAFATALIGESALLAGDLDTAERELGDAVALHHDLDSTAGEAHSLQRLAEVHLARGDDGTARALLNRALPLARWSIIATHLLQRIHGTLISAAPDPMRARAEVDRAEAALGVDDWCPFCSIMLALPAAIACARSGDLDHARHHLRIAERSAKLWEATAWQGWYAEAVGHLALAGGDPSNAGLRFAEAASLFDRAGQPGDTDRCRRLAAEAS